MARFTQRAVLLTKFSEFTRPHLLQTERGILRIVSSSYKLINLQVEDVVVTVLGVLTQWIPGFPHPANGV